MFTPLRADQAGSECRQAIAMILSPPNKTTQIVTAQVHVLFNHPHPRLLHSGPITAKQAFLFLWLPPHIQTNPRFRFISRQKDRVIARAKKGDTYGKRILGGRAPLSPHPLELGTRSLLCRSSQPGRTQWVWRGLGVRRSRTAQVSLKW